MWPQASAVLGQVLLTDNVHLNNKGGALLLELVRPFVEKSLVPKDHALAEDKLASALGQPEPLTGRLLQEQEGKLIQQPPLAEGLVTEYCETGRASAA